MGIAFRASSSADLGSPAASQSVTLPTGTQSTDVCVLVWAVGNNANAVGDYSAPSGWTQVAAQFTQNLPSGPTTVGVHVWWALGSIANLTFTKSGTVAFTGWVCLSFTGVDNTTPIDVAGTASGNNSSSTITPGSITIATSGAWELYAITDNNDGAFSATGFTNVENAHVQQAAACMYNATGKSVGAAAGVTVTDSGGASSNSLAVLPFALRPASTGGSTFFPFGDIRRRQRANLRV